MNIRKSIGINLKKARLDNNIAQEKLADKLNISHPHYNKIENGNYSLLNLDLMWNISKILKTPFHKLFEINEE
ncbi:MAG: transcriptional regulator with XRE-family HTH domain [Rickettsiales bacterium]|jgi:transcriptional regulator with XRE-family HTH domain